MLAIIRKMSPQTQPLTGYVIGNVSYDKELRHEMFPAITGRSDKLY